MTSAPPPPPPEGDDEQRWRDPHPEAGPALPAAGGRRRSLVPVIAVVVVVLLVAAAAVAFLVLRSDGPADTAEDYLEAVADYDYEGVCELSVKEERDAAFEQLKVDSCADLAQAYDEQQSDADKAALEVLEDVDVTFEVGEVTEDGDTATVDYTTKSKYTGDDEAGFKKSTGNDSLENDTEGTLELRKEDGDWKVSIGT